MSRKMFFPRDWMSNRPYKTVGEADIYTFYDKARAENDALAFFVDPRACNYETACLLHDLDALPDARLESLKGPEYGRQFLHDNGRFIADYFFSRYRGDE